MKGARVYLKTLTLRGFKSFASATALRFEPGITCVVGPNGSGKSNVVDALAWVMGEHSAKSLRGGKMEDVIFAGTSNRAPLGRAEVTLTIDNTDGALPIDYTEVTISRLMFRSGQSEYAINGDTCRLLDIQELLSDSGIGREMHVIVGQGQLDAVLHAGPEDRRAFIEEAAGVLKHRKRKEKALRKLDAMQANLTRVQDLATELRRQLKPLGRQAEIARKAAVIQADLRDARLRLLADDVGILRLALEREAADEAAILGRRAQVERELAEGQQREAALEAAETEAQPRLSAAQETYFRLSSLRERTSGLEQLAAERHRHALDAAAIERRGREPEELEREAAQAREQELILSAELEHAQELLEEAVTRRTEAEAALRAEEQRLAMAARAAADRREGLARMRGQVDSARSRARAADEEIGRLAQAVVDASERERQARADLAEAQQAEPTIDPALAAELDTAQELVEAARATADEARAGVEAAKSALDTPRAALQSTRSAVGTARKRDQEAQRAVAALQARREALDLALARGADGAATLLDADLSGLLGPLAAAMTVSPGAELAIAAVLGPVTEALAVKSLDTALDAFGLLREKDTGQVTLLIASDVPVRAGARPRCARAPGRPSWSAFRRSSARPSTTSCAASSWSTTCRRPETSSNATPSSGRSPETATWSAPIWRRAARQGLVDPADAHRSRPGHRRSGGGRARGGGERPRLRRGHRGGAGRPGRAGSRPGPGQRGADGGGRGPGRGQRRTGHARPGARQAARVRPAQRGGGQAAGPARSGGHGRRSRGRPAGPERVQGGGGQG